MDLTENNSQMKTVVETFLIEETAELIYDGDKLSEWHKHIQDLNLTGQKKIVSFNKSPIPFMHMKSSTSNILETLCPTKVSILEYNCTPIPLQVLDLIALSEKEKYFDYMQIWYDGKSPDPVCIGFKYTSEDARNNKYTWQTEKYLMAKWGDIKQSFQELKERAIVRYKEERVLAIKREMIHMEREIQDINIATAQIFGSDLQFNF